MSNKIQILICKSGDLQNAHQEANDEKIANIQRALGELKGSVEGVKIRIEVEGEGWRGRVEGLEKEIENLKEEADDEIIATKHSIRNEFKIKIGDFMADVDKMRREEREKVLTCVYVGYDSPSKSSVPMSTKLRLSVCLFSGGTKRHRLVHTFHPAGSSAPLGVIRTFFKVRVKVVAMCLFVWFVGLERNYGGRL